MSLGDIIVFTAVVMVVYLIIDTYGFAEREQDEHCTDTTTNAEFHELVNHIENATNVNGIVYRQRRRELRNLANVNARNQQAQNQRLIDEYVERQEYIDANLDATKIELFNDLMRRIRVYSKSMPSHAFIPTLKQMCEDTLTLAGEIGSRDDSDIDVVHYVLTRCEQSL